MLRVVAPANQTCLAANQVVAGCEKLLQSWEQFYFFCNKICTCCAGKPVLQQVTQVLGMAWLPRNFIQSDVSIHTTCNNLIYCKEGLSVGGKTHIIAFELVFQQCCKTSCTFLPPVLPKIKWNFTKFLGTAPLTQFWLHFMKGVCFE